MFQLNTERKLQIVPLDFCPCLISTCVYVLKRHFVQVYGDMYIGGEYHGYEGMIQR